MKFEWGSVGSYNDKDDPSKGIKEMRNIIADGPMITPVQLAISILPIAVGLVGGLLAFGGFAFENGARAWESGEFNALKDLGIIKE